MSTHPPIHVLFLCTHNSARSIMAEAILNELGKGRFVAFSAGSTVSEDQRPHALALEALEHAGLGTDGLKSKNWEVFAQPSAPHMDLIITVCDNAAGEVCPVWPGHPATAHWGYPDPSEGDKSDADKLEAFRHTLHAMQQRLSLLINLPADKLAHAVLETSARALSSR